MLQFALGRLVLRRSSQPSLEAAAALLERSCNRLADLLVGPLARDLDGRDLVVVPTGELHALAWALAPIAPRPGRDGLAIGVAVVLPPVRGPLASHGSQRRALVRSSSSQGRGSPTRRRRSTGSARLFTRGRGPCKDPPRLPRRSHGAFERRRLAHVAAHGTFRADNPQFSSLEMADGPHHCLRPRAHGAAA